MSELQSSPTSSLTPSGAPLRPRGAYKKSAQSRLQVVDAAIRALAANGFARTSVNDIAAAAGMSKGAVHYHFETKDDLMARVLERCADVLLRRVRGGWGETTDPRERLRQTLRALWVVRSDEGPEARVLADLMAQAQHDPRLRELVSAMYRSTRSDIAARLARELDAHGLEFSVPAEAAVRVLSGALDGMAIRQGFDPAADAEQEVILGLLERFVVSLSRPKMALRTQESA